MNQPSTPTDLARRFSATMAWLQSAVAARGGRDRVFALIVPLLWNYLGRAGRRFAALAKRVEAGRATPKPRAPRPEPSAPSEPHPQTRPEKRPRKPLPFPTGLGWLVRIEQQTAIAGCDLKALFRDPAFAAFLEAAPQVERILRPLCQMLGILRDPDLPPALLRTPTPRRRKPTSRAPDITPAPERPEPPYRPLARRYRLILKSA